MTFARLTDGFRNVAERARARDIRIIGATLPPFRGALPDTPMAGSYHSSDKDALRRRINDWIRSSGTFDAAVDFDRVVRDPASPDRLLAAYDSGDHLHPGAAAGNAAMTDAVDLRAVSSDACAIKARDRT